MLARQRALLDGQIAVDHPTVLSYQPLTGAHPQWRCDRHTVGHFCSAKTSSARPCIWPKSRNGCQHAAGPESLPRCSTVRQIQWLSSRAQVERHGVDNPIKTNRSCPTRDMPARSSAPLTKLAILAVLKLISTVAARHSNPRNPDRSGSRLLYSSTAQRLLMPGHLRSALTTLQRRR